MIGINILHYKVVEKLGEGGSPREIGKDNLWVSYNSLNIMLAGEYYQSNYLTG